MTEKRQRVCAGTDCVAHDKVQVATGQTCGPTVSVMGTAATAATFAIVRIVCTFAAGDSVLQLLRTCKVMHSYRERLQASRLFSERIRAGLKRMSPLLLAAMDSDGVVLSGSFLLQLILGIDIGRDPRWQGGDIDLYYPMSSSSTTKKDDTRTTVPALRKYLQQQRMELSQSAKNETADTYQHPCHLGLVKVETFVSTKNDVGQSSLEKLPLQLLGVPNPQEHIAGQFDMPFLKNAWCRGRLVMHCAGDIANRHCSSYRPHPFSAEDQVSKTEYYAVAARRILRYLNRGFAVPGTSETLSWQEQRVEPVSCVSVWSLGMQGDHVEHFVHHVIEEETPCNKALERKAPPLGTASRFSVLKQWCMGRLFAGKTTRAQLTSWFGATLMVSCLTICKWHAHCKFCDALGVKKTENNCESIGHEALLWQCRLCEGWVCHRTRCRRLRFDTSAPACLDCLEELNKPRPVAVRFVDDDKALAEVSQEADRDERDLFDSVTGNYGEITAWHERGGRERYVKAAAEFDKRLAKTSGRHLVLRKYVLRELGRLTWHYHYKECDSDLRRRNNAELSCIQHIVTFNSCPVLDSCPVLVIE